MNLFMDIYLLLHIYVHGIRASPFLGQTRTKRIPSSPPSLPRAPPEKCTRLASWCLSWPHSTQRPMSNASWVNGVAGHYTDDEKHRAGIDSYAARAATKTKANSTLFVRNLSVKTEAAALAERIFVECPGYFGVRSVRSMVFVDFDSIKAATNAMLRFQGHRPVPGHTGMVSGAQLTMYNPAATPARVPCACAPPR